MALNNLGLGFVFTARDLASGAIGNLERNFMSLDRRVGLRAGISNPIVLPTHATETRGGGHNAQSAQ